MWLDLFEYFFPEIEFIYDLIYLIILPFFLHENDLSGHSKSSRYPHSRGRDLIMAVLVIAGRRTIFYLRVYATETALRVYNGWARRRLIFFRYYVFCLGGILKKNMLFGTENMLESETFRKSYKVTSWSSRWIIERSDLVSRTQKRQKRTFQNALIHVIPGTKISDKLLVVTEFWLIIVRSTLYVRDLRIRLSVRPVFVRPSVRPDYNHFLRRGYGPGDTSYVYRQFEAWILGVPKKEPPKVGLANGTSIIGTPVLDCFWWHFLEKVEKKVTCKLGCTLARSRCSVT